MSRCSLAFVNVISHLLVQSVQRLLLGALMSFTVAGVQVFRSGVDAVMSCIGLYVGERPPVQIDVMGDPGMADRMGRELPHFGRILDKSILLCQFCAFTDDHHDQIP